MTSVLLELVRDEDESVRWQAVAAISVWVGEGNCSDHPLVEALVAAADDLDEDVREGAAFMLRCLEECDSSAIRSCLWNLLARGGEPAVEAMFALALRGEPGVVPHINDALQVPEVSLFLVMAAEAAGAAALLPALLQLKADGWSGGGGHEYALEAAIAACSATTDSAP